MNAIASPSPTSRPLAGRALLLARVVWLVLAALQLLSFVPLLPAYLPLAEHPCPQGCLLTAQEAHSLTRAGISLYVYVGSLLVAAVLKLLLAAAVAGILFVRRSHEVMALITAYFVLLLPTFLPINEAPIVIGAAQTTAFTLPLVLDRALGVLQTATLYGMFLLFPSGRFVPRRSWALLLGFVAYSTVWTALPELQAALILGWPVFLASAAACMGYRYRRVSTPVERQQTKWVLFGFLTFLIASQASWLPTYTPLGDTVYAPLAYLAYQLLLPVVPISFLIAVLRYRLFDIDTILNRTLVYGGLTGIVVGSYVLIVSALGALFQARGNVLIALVATGVIAVLFQPLRSGLQRLVDRLFFGERDNPYAVLSRLGRRLETALAPEVVLPTIMRATRTIRNRTRTEQTGGARMNVQRAPTAMAERRDRRGPARLRGRGLLLARGAWVALVALTLVIFSASLPAYSAQLQTPCAGTACVYQQLTPGHVAALAGIGLSLGGYAAATVALLLAGLAVCLAVSALIAWRRPDEPMALWVALLLVTVGTFGASVSLPWGHSPWQVARVCLTDLMLALLVLVFLLFPSGQFVPRWTRWILVVLLVGQVSTVFLPEASLLPYTPMSKLGWLVAVVEMALVAAVQLYRYRRVSSLIERQQTKWVVFGLAAPIAAYVVLTVLALGFPALAEAGAVYVLANNELGFLLTLCLPLAFGFAILRYRLFDIDTILNRTLVYGGLTGIVVGSYVLIVSALGALFQARGNVLIALVATGVIAVLFQPLRSGLQRLVDRLFFGERDNPYAVLSRLGRRLETALAPEVVLPTIVETVAQALKLPAAVIEIHEDDHSRVAAAYGAQHTAVITFPLLYQSEIVGQLRVAPRAPDEPLTRGDKRLLEDIAHQAGVAVHATRLTLDLQHSRERLVSAREEERRRLRRDLHDGLGPTLAGQTLKVGAIRNLLTRDPSAADRLLLELGGEIEVAIADIRRLVYALRPPALDELGLVAALRAEVLRHGTEEHGVSGSGGDRETRLRVTVDAPQTLPPLPAAVEVAAYRIACEALTNTIRHAQATACRIRLTLDDALHVEVADDGMGLPVERRMGVGLVSMRERAEELGGVCVITSAPGRGVRVLATLPLEKE